MNRVQILPCRLVSLSGRARACEETKRGVEDSSPKRAQKRKKGAVEAWKLSVLSFVHLI
jgi:hypothetical protein